MDTSIYAIAERRTAARGQLELLTPLVQRARGVVVTQAAITMHGATDAMRADAAEEAIALATLILKLEAQTREDAK